jgi:hypothetical protein
MLSFDTDDGRDLPGAENATAKAFNLGRGWYALGAGDLGIAKAIVIRVLKIFSKTEGNRPAGRATRPEIEEAFRSAYKRVRNERIDDTVLNPFHLDWRAYHKGRASGLHEEIEEYIINFDLNVGFLVFGSEGQFQHLLQVRDPGIIEDRVHLGYWAIGKGAITALGALTVRLIGSLPHLELIYRLCEAKFSCEDVDSIGRATNVLLVNAYNNQALQLNQEYIDQLRTIWERERRSTAPADAIDIIAEALRRSRCA